MSVRPPLSPEIPAEILERVAAFLRDRRSGSVTLHVDDGRVRVLDVRETYRPTRSEPRR